MSTYGSRELATAEARKVLKLMKTKGWKIEVWENLGWHFCLRNYRLSLYESRYGAKPPQYSCLLASNDRAPGSGSCLWSPQQGHHRSDPNVAVEVQMRLAEAVVRELHESLQATRLHLKYGRTQASKKALPSRRRAVR